MLFIAYIWTTVTLCLSYFSSKYVNDLSFHRCLDLLENPKIKNHDGTWLGSEPGNAGCKSTA